MGGEDRLDETELVEQAKAGDLDAFEHLVVLHQRAALQVAYVIAGSDAEDATQEAFVKSFRALGAFRSGSPFRPWLLRIVANEARNQRRSATRRAGLALRLVERPAAVERSPEEAALGAISRAELVRAVSSLPERGRRVDFPLAIPPRLGPPDAVYVDEAASETVVSFVYRPRSAFPEVRSTGVGFLVSQFRGRVDTAVMTKFLGPPISIAGGRGFWLPEPGHVVMYLDRQDEIQEDTARLTANVLLFERDGVITRLESRLSRDEMLGIAASTG